MIDDIDLNALPVFVAAVEAGSFTAAADRLGCTKTKVSLNIRALERHLGLALFNRTTRQVTLTEAGQQLYRSSQPLLAQLGETLSDAGTTARTLGGILRMTAPADHMAQSLAPAAAAFGEQHPNLTIELRSGDRVTDMVGEGIDLAIRMGWLKDSTLRAQKLGEFGQTVVATPGYLKSQGVPDHPSELSRHRWIEFTPLPSGLTWWFEKDGERVQVSMNSHLKVDSTSAVRSLILNGAGLSVLAGDVSRQHPELVTVLPDWQLPRGGIYAVFPPGAFIPAKVRVFVDFYRQWLTKAE